MPVNVFPDLAKALKLLDRIAMALERLEKHQAAIAAALVNLERQAEAAEEPHDEAQRPELRGS